WAAPASAEVAPGRRLRAAVPGARVTRAAASRWHCDGRRADRGGCGGGILVPSSPGTTPTMSRRRRSRRGAWGRRRGRPRTPPSRRRRRRPGAGPARAAGATRNRPWRGTRRLVVGTEHPHAFSFAARQSLFVVETERVALVIVAPVGHGTPSGPSPG